MSLFKSEPQTTDDVLRDSMMCHWIGLGILILCAIYAASKTNWLVLFVILGNIKIAQGLSKRISLFTRK